MKKMKRGGKVHKRMQVGGMAMDPRFAAAAAANPANAPTRGSRPDNRRGAAMSLLGTMVRPGAMGGARGARGIGSRDEGPMVRPGFPSGPRPKGYGPNDGGPRPMGPRTPGPKGPMVRPGVPTAPRGAPVAQPLPRIGYGPNDGPVTGGIPAGMTKDEYLGTFTDRKPFDTEGKPSPMGPRSVAPYDDTPTATRTPSGPGKTKYPLDSNGNYIIPPGTVTQTTLGGSLGLKKGGAVKSKAMRGGGLARKGVGMALAKGGLARRAGGCAQRGVGRGKIT